MTRRRRRKFGSALSVHKSSLALGSGVVTCAARRVPGPKRSTMPSQMAEMEALSQCPTVATVRQLAHIGALEGRHAHVPVEPAVVCLVVAAIIVRPVRREERGEA